MKKVFDFERSLLRVPGELPDDFYVKRPEARPVDCWFFTPNSDGWHREPIGVERILYSSADGVFTRTVYVVVRLDRVTGQAADVRLIDAKEVARLKTWACKRAASRRRDAPHKDEFKWVEIPFDKIKQADLPGLIGAFNEFCLRLWGIKAYIDQKEADVQRQTDFVGMKLTCRRLAEYAERELGDGTALLRISGLLPAAQPAASEWDAGWEVVRRLEMRHAPQNGRAETGLSGGSNKRPAYDRDHLWLKWNEEDKIGPAKIRDQWDAMPDDERKAVCPKCWEKIGDVDNNAGRETVKTALGKAKREK